MNTPPPPAYPASPRQTAIPTQAVSPRQVGAHEGEMFEVTENERWFPLAGWGQKLLPTDPRQFTLSDGTAAKSPPGPAAPPPLGRVWVEGEKWECGPWMYAVDFPFEYVPVMGKAHCVRRRVWRRRVLPEIAPLPSVPGGNREAAAGAAAAPSGTTVLEGPLGAQWTGGSARHAVFDAGRLFLLDAPGSSKAALTVPVAKIATITEVHHLEIGAPHAFALGLDEGPQPSPGAEGPPGGVTRVDLIAPDDEAREQWMATLKQASKAARPVVIPALKRGAKVVGDNLGQGVKLMGGYFAGSLGAGMGWTVGGRAGNRMANGMGM